MHDTDMETMVFSQARDVVPPCFVLSRICMWIDVHVDKNAMPCGQSAFANARVGRNIGDSFGRGSGGTVFVKSDETPDGWLS